LKRVVGIQTTNLRNLQGEEKTRLKKLNQEFTENQVPTILEKIEDLIGQEEVRLEGSQLEGTQKVILLFLHDAMVFTNFRMSMITKNYKQRPKS
jgi:hypothetical protein